MPLHAPPVEAPRIVNFSTISKDLRLPRADAAKGQGLARIFGLLHQPEYDSEPRSSPHKFEREKLGEEITSRQLPDMQK